MSYLNIWSIKIFSSFESYLHLKLWNGNVSLMELHALYVAILKVSDAASDGYFMKTTKFSCV